MSAPGPDQAFCNSPCHCHSAPRPQSTRIWRLLRGEGRRLRGQPEGGNVSNQFFLIKERGSPDFVAVPVDAWVTFRPEAAPGSRTLESAEAAMAAARLQADRINPRFAAALQASGVSEAAAAAAEGGPDPEGNEPDSDEEWAGIKARAATRATLPQQGLWSLLMPRLKGLLLVGGNPSVSCPMMSAMALALSDAELPFLLTRSNHRAKKAAGGSGGATSQRRGGGGGRSR